MKITLALAILSAFCSPVLASAPGSGEQEPAGHRLLRSSHQRRAEEAANTTLSFDPATTAMLIIDPQNDFLSPEGVAWGVVGTSVTEHNVVGNIEKLFAAAAENQFLTFVSPHYYYPHERPSLGV